MDNSKTYIGIDVGSKGFISVQKNNKWDFLSLEDNDIYSISDFLHNLSLENDSIACVIEDVHAIFGSSAKSTFQFGFNKGFLIGILCANKIPYSLVSPSVWQKAIWNNSDIVITYKEVTVKGKKLRKKEVNTKQTSINACKRLFPTLDLRKSERSKKVDDNKVDSILMSEFARRKNL